MGAVLEVSFRTAGQFLVAYCTNLSRGGLFVSTPTPAPVGSLLHLELEVPEQRQRVTVTAQVRWTRAEPGEDGPAGMGLRFDGLDDRLGDTIDRLVATAKPLQIALVGRPDRATKHLEALVRALVSCTSTQHAPTAMADEALLSADLVLVDVDADAERALALLEHMHGLDHAPPAVALIGARATDRRERFARVARVLATPVDKAELQAAVLDGLAQARGAPKEP